MYIEYCMGIQANQSLGFSVPGEVLFSHCGLNRINVINQFYLYFIVPRFTCSATSGRTLQLLLSSYHDIH